MIALPLARGRWRRYVRSDAAIVGQIEGVWRDAEALVCAFRQAARDANRPDLAEWVDQAWSQAVGIMGGFLDRAERIRALDQQMLAMIEARVDEQTQQDRAT